MRNRALKVVKSFQKNDLSSPGRTRTYDPAVNSRLLYQLSYRGMVVLVAVMYVIVLRTTR